MSNYTLEREIEAKLRKLVREHGGLCLKWTCPGWAGVPDRICLFPGGRVIFIELKRPSGGVIAKRQQYWIEKLRSLGFLAGFCNDDEALEDLEMHLSYMLSDEDAEP